MRRGPEVFTNRETETDHGAVGRVPGLLLTKGTDMVSNQTTLFIYHVGQHWWGCGVLDTGSIGAHVAGVIFLETILCSVSKVSKMVTWFLAQ